MEPIEFSVSLELGSLVIAAVAGLATLLHQRQTKALRRQRERHHQEMRALAERHHRERLDTMRQSERAIAQRV